VARKINKLEEKLDGQDLEAGSPRPFVRRVNLDALDRQLIDALREDGRVANRTLANRLGVMEATVGQRIRRLSDEKVVRVVAVTDMEAMGHQLLTVLKVVVKGRPVPAVARTLAAIPEVANLSIVYGPYDVFAVLLARDRQHLDHLLRSQIPAVLGVDRFDCDLALGVWLYRAEWGFLDREGHPPMPDSRPGAVDSLDLDIIRLLQTDGRSSYRKLGLRLGIPENTLKHRIRRLEQERIIRIVAITDPLQLGLAGGAFIGLQIDGAYAGAIGDELRTIKELQFAASAVGHYDILAGCLVEGREQLFDLVTNRIPAIPGVIRTETTEMVQVVKHSYTWTLLTRP
jgi:Lrp/AsnC family transcriptional regulator for asnA, asnC and gidA